MQYYIEDAANARRNLVTVFGNTSPAYDCVLSVKFSNEDTTEPVTLAEAKDWCAVDGNDFDGKLTMLIKAGRKKIESLKQKSFVNRTVEAKIKKGTNLPYGPVIAITSIKSLVDDTVTYTKLEDTTEDVAVTYTAGPGENPLSDEYKVEILQQVAFMLENRGDEKAGSGPISPLINGNISRLPIARVK